MKRICPCFTPSRITLAEGARETVSLGGTLSTQTRDCTTFTLQDFYIESETAHRIKINYYSCFHNSWPNSKTKLKLKHLWEQGCFGGPMQPVYSAYREDRLCIYMWFWLLLLICKLLWIKASAKCLNVNVVLKQHKMKNNQKVWRNPSSPWCL